MIRKRYALYGALICILLLFALTFTVGMRAGLHDAQEISEGKMQENIAAIKSQHETQICELTAEYDSRIALLEAELEKEKKIQRVETEYVPMPVNYETAAEIPETELTMLAKLGIGEDTLIDYRPEAVAAVYETVFNRVDSADPFFPNTVAGVILQEYQYSGYSAENPVDKRYYDLALDCWYRWQIKKLAVGDCGYTIPEDCVSFRGDGYRNYFSWKGQTWDWSLPNPYLIQEEAK